MIPISLCMIVKNEEKNLRKCLDNIKDYVDEIIIVDTGSTDKTKEIAHEYTDKVYNFDWVMDFSEARSFSITKATNDWILVLDADEFIINFDKSTVQNFMKKNIKVVGRILRINAIAGRDQHSEEQKSLERVSRLFNKNYFHYEGRIHEQVTPIDGEDFATAFIDISADHIGYIGYEIKDKNKWERNKTILEESIKEKPNDSYLYYHLGKVSYLMGDYEKAASYIDRAISIGVDYNLEYVQDMILTYGYSLLNQNQYEKGLSILEYEPYFKNSADYYFILALIYMNKGDLKESVEYFNKCIGKIETVIGTSSYLPYYNIGVIYEVLEDYKAAIIHYDICNGYSFAESRLKDILKKQVTKDSIKELIETGELEIAYKLLNIMEKYILDDPDIYSMKGVILIIENDLEEAKKEIEKGLLIAPADDDLLYNLEHVKRIKDKD